MVAAVHTTVVPWSHDILSAPPCAEVVSSSVRQNIISEQVVSRGQSRNDEAVNGGGGARANIL